MTTQRTILGLREALEPLRAGARIGLVPTMGALHAGHEALIRRARAECDVVVASIFVNPAQFGALEDLDRYPRDEDGDAELAAGWGVDHLFVPSVAEMYPQGFQTWVDVEAIAEDLEGAGRPGHFRGVATVCLKLFNIVGPDVAYFGRKDAQQAAVVERDGARPRPAAGDPRGGDRARPRRRGHELAQRLPLAGGARGGRGDPPRARRREPRRTGRARTAPRPRGPFSRASRSSTPEYVEVARLDGRLYLLAAVRVGRTRLIDNVVLEGDPE